MPTSTHAQVIAVGGLQGGLCKEMPEAASFWTQPVPATSSEPTVDTAEPISQTGNTSGKTYSRKMNNIVQTVRSVGKKSETVLQSSRSEKKAKEVCQVLEHYILAAHGETMVEHICPYSPCRSPH